MRSRLTVGCILAVLVLSSIDLTYEWYAPLSGPEGRVDWYSQIGLINGVLVYANHEPPGGGMFTGLHLPRLAPMPFYAGAGPEGGGILVAIWFLGSVGWIILLMLFSRRARTAATRRTH
jgi:hypothetical protein